jgi:predicted dithiol-disulfide oxidoreductase (DUF899 family)
MTTLAPCFTGSSRLRCYRLLLPALSRAKCFICTGVVRWAPCVLASLAKQPVKVALVVVAQVKEEVALLLLLMLQHTPWHV